MKELKVALKDNTYSIYIGSNILSDLESFIPQDLKSYERYFICDENTQCYAKQLAKTAPIHVINSGEASKSFKIYEETMSFLLDHKINRKSVVFAVGGGVVGDLAGFIAATVMRGVPVIQIPTTLLAMVDSSVGGKTGINAPQGKNLVGAFHQPSAVICDIDVLKTLPERELKAGYAEALKYSLLGDCDFFDWLEENGKSVLDLDEEVLTKIIHQSCEMKAEIVLADEKEISGQRALLNLGHTFAHAFEAVMKYDGRLLHGEAVAIGMICAMELSHYKGYLDAQQIERVAQHISEQGLKKSVRDIGLPEDITSKDILSIMRGDKKAAAGKISFVLMKRIGEAFLSDSVSDQDVLNVLDKMKATE